MKKLKDLVISRGRRTSTRVHTRDITLDDWRYVFFPKDETEKYHYLGNFYVNKYKNDKKTISHYYEAIMPIVRLMDKKACPWWCPRFFLRFLDVYGNDKSIYRVRNYKLYNIFRKITKGYLFIDWKTKWNDHDLRISIQGDEELWHLVDKTERDFYKKRVKENILLTNF
jgi:hypothetical protein